VRLVLERENFEDVLPVQTENHSADVGWDLLISDKIRLVDRWLASLLMLLRSMLVVDIGDGSLWSRRPPAGQVRYGQVLGWRRRPKGRLVARGL
jgi:hypothetical protein